MKIIQFMKSILLSITTFIGLFLLCASNKIHPNDSKGYVSFDVQYKNIDGMNYALIYYQHIVSNQSWYANTFSMSSHNLTLEKAQIDYFAKQSTLLDKVIFGQNKQTELLSKINYSAWKSTNQMDSLLTKPK